MTVPGTAAVPDLPLASHRIGYAYDDAAGTVTVSCDACRLAVTLTRDEPVADALEGFIQRHDAVGGGEQVRPTA